MSADKPDKDKFDEIIERALRLPLEPVPAGFTERVVSRIEQARQKKILGRVVLQERLALAGCIALGTLTFILTAVFSGPVTTFLGNITVGLIEQKQVLLDEAPMAVWTFKNDWQLYLVSVTVFAFAVYSLVDLFAVNGKRKYLHIKNCY